jgi:hypothetical protein
MNTAGIIKGYNATLFCLVKVNADYKKIQDMYVKSSSNGVKVDLFDHTGDASA